MSNQELKATKPQMIALKSDGVAGPRGGGGGLRSPLVSQQAVLLSKPVAKAGQPAAEAAPPQPVAYSKISGLDDPSHHLNHLEQSRTKGTRLSLDLFNASMHPVQQASRGLLLLALLGGIGFLAAVPSARDRALLAVTKAKNQVIAFTRHRKPPQRRHVSEAAQAETAATLPFSHSLPSDSAAKPFSPPSCPGLMRDMQGSGHANGPLWVKLQTADCYLLKDDPTNAEKALAEAATKLRGNNKAGADLAGYGEAALTLQSALLKQGNELAAAQLVGSGCGEWHQATSCVAKLMLAAARRPVVPVLGDLNKMFGSQGLLPAKSEARLWLAGALLASANGTGEKTVDQRFKLALERAPKDAFALRKEIYEARVTELWQRGDAAQVKATLATAWRDLALVGPGDLVKLKLLGDLAASGSDARRLHGLLTREDVLFRLRGDLDLIDVVAPEALRSGLAKDLAGVLKRATDFTASHYHAGSVAGKRLQVWQIRTALASRDTDLAVSLLASYAKSYGDDALSHHLRGTTYLALTTAPAYQHLAASELQAAVRMKADWESLYGLALALVRAHRLPQATGLIADLAQAAHTQNQRYWLDMLRAEIALGQLNYSETGRILAPWQRAEPPLVAARTLQLQVYQKTGKTSAAEALKVSLSVGAGRQPPATSPESFSSPLGCMALAKRHGYP